MLLLRVSWERFLSSLIAHSVGSHYLLNSSAFSASYRKAVPPSILIRVEVIGAGLLMRILAGADMDQ